jgi:Protein of unknown function (DUF3043)
VFGRKPAESSSSTSTPTSKAARRRATTSGPASGVDDATAAREGSKGHPTPKRREAERGRRRAITAPRDRKTAYRETRERQREDRTRKMHALKAGDETHLPARDRGPVRKYARDLVDARRSVAEYFLPLALVILTTSFLHNDRLKEFGSALWLALVVLIVLDSIVLAFRLRRGLDRTLPDVGHKGAVAYALMRSMQIRRFRLPPPRIKGRGFRRPS